MTLAQMAKLGYNYTSSNRINDRGATGIAHGLSPERELLMQDNSTRLPSFSANAEYYAPWVATHGLVAPYGNFPPAWTMVCEHCREAQAAHWHHHNGYADEYKLDVIALCFDCHGKEHRVHD